MSNANFRNKSVEGVYLTENLQQEFGKCIELNTLIVNDKVSFADGVCNTSYASTKYTDTHAANAGIAAPDTPQHIRDIEGMTEAALKRAYPKEHNSWRGRRATAKNESLPWFHEFDTFSGFLRIAGPKPKHDYQLDKIIHEAGYVPGNIRWASPRENGLNRDHIRYLTHDGETHPVSVWARKKGISKSTIFSRLRRGWSDSAAITSCQAGQFQSSSVKDKLGELPWPEKNSAAWEMDFQQYGDKTYSHYSRLFHYGRTCHQKLMRLASEHYRITDLYIINHEVFPDDELPDEEQRFISSYPQEFEKWNCLLMDARDKAIKKIPRLAAWGGQSFSAAIEREMQRYKESGDI